MRVKTNWNNLEVVSAINKMSCQLSECSSQVHYVLSIISMSSSFEVDKGLRICKYVQEKKREKDL